MNNFFHQRTSVFSHSCGIHQQDWFCDSIFLIVGNLSPEIGIVNRLPSERKALFTSQRNPWGKGIFNLCWFIIFIWSGIRPSPFSLKIIRKLKKKVRTAGLGFQSASLVSALDFWARADEVCRSSWRRFLVLAWVLRSDGWLSHLL